MPFRCGAATGRPGASNKRVNGVQGQAAEFGSELIHDGDWLIANEDGVVVGPQEKWEGLLDRAMQKKLQDAAHPVTLGEG